MSRYPDTKVRIPIDGQKSEKPCFLVSVHAREVQFTFLKSAHLDHCKNEFTYCNFWYGYPDSPKSFGIRISKSQCTNPTHNLDYSCLNNYNVIMWGPLTKTLQQKATPKRRTTALFPFFSESRSNFWILRLVHSKTSIPLNVATLTKVLERKRV